MAGDYTFTSIRSKVERLTTPAAADDLQQWLAETEGGARRDAGLEWLLATTFSEVVWGLKKDGAWRLSRVGATLPADRLLELRAFGSEAEVFVWRDATGLHARRLADGAGEEMDTFCEEQLLWGTESDPHGKAAAGFTPLRDGEQGLRHAPPLALDAGYFITDEDDERFGHRPARLVLRHYVDRDDATGLARVVDSRLVKVRRQSPTEQEGTGGKTG